MSVSLRTGLSNHAHNPGRFTAPTVKVRLWKSRPARFISAVFFPFSTACPFRPCGITSRCWRAFGGPARLRYHGVSRIIPGTAPPELGLAGRLNLTFRQYDV
jgi:alkylated DNA repair protein (DNA oxidative demethylase)